MKNDELILERLNELIPMVELLMRKTIKGADGLSEAYTARMVEILNKLERERTQLNKPSGVSPAFNAMKEILRG